MKHGIILNKLSNDIGGNLLLSRALYKMANIGGHESFLISSHNILRKTKLSKTSNNHARQTLEKDAALKDFQPFKWWFNRRDKKKKLKIQNTVKRIISDQGKLNRTVKFTYTNLSGKKSSREVDPYEIKGRHLWAFDRGSDAHIKKFFINKLENVTPGKNTFEPQWEVKFAMEKDKTASIRSALRTPGFLRSVETAIGGITGAAIGYGGSADENKADRVGDTIQGALIGSVSALTASALIRSNILKAGIKRRQEKKWTKPVHEIVINKKKIIDKSYPQSMKAIRKEWDEVNDPARFKKYIQRRQRKNSILATDEVMKMNLKDQIPNLKTRGQREAFDRGFLAKGKPRFLKADTSEAYALGKTIRGSFFNEAAMQELGQKTQLDVAKRIASLKHMIGYDDIEATRRLGKSIDRKLFRKL